jgi:hypothetical protein
MTSVDNRVGAGGFDEPFSAQAMMVVAAAREWATAIWRTNERLPVEFMNEPLPATIGTEEERARQALLDAVHDLEHHRDSPWDPRARFPLFDLPA